MIILFLILLIFAESEFYWALVSDHNNFWNSQAFAFIDGVILGGLVFSILFSPYPRRS